MKLDFNGAVRNALKEQEAIRELLEKIEAGDFGEEIQFYADKIDAWNGESAFLLGELITEMIKALDNSKLSEDDKEKAKDAITEAAKAIIKNNESER